MASLPFPLPQSKTPPRLIGAISRRDRPLHRSLGAGRGEGVSNAKNRLSPERNRETTSGLSHLPSPSTDGESPATQTTLLHGKAT